ncbi:MAG: TetR/AcrR family transcriptional regulator [Ktedonobacteraceae bacterium]|nr:TetR/AcrR family transcriptional regulator [Ktedonobacteraceae bacterium]
MARTPKTVEDRREQIIDAALRVFARKGFARSTNKDIAREAGITPGLIYHYFENKQAVFKAVVEERSPLKIVRTLPPDMLGLPPEQFMRFLLLRVLNVIESEQFVQIIRVMLPEAVHGSEFVPIGVSILQQVINFLEQYLRTKMEQGVLQQINTSFVAQTFTSCVMGFVLRRQVLRDPSALQYSQEQIAENVVNTILHGLLPR